MTFANDYTILTVDREEISIILPGIDRVEAEYKATCWLKTLHDANTPHAPASTIPYISMSIGIAYTDPSGHCASPEWLIEHADQALYYAKSRGRNQLAWNIEAE